MSSEFAAASWTGPSLKARPHCTFATDPHFAFLIDTLLDFGWPSACQTSPISNHFPSTFLRRLITKTGVQLFNLSFVILSMVENPDGSQSRYCRFPLSSLPKRCAYLFHKGHKMELQVVELKQGHPVAKVLR
ncbi:MAG: hypothetical protein ACFFEA_13230 [Candidatus Thorarchaeota archaeon]